MDYKQCPHYPEMLQVLAEGRDLEDISFNIDEVQGCPHCSGPEAVCTLWIVLGLVSNLTPQLGLEQAALTIDTLDEQAGGIAMALLNRRAANQNEDRDL